jgi:16S rRNA C967 or C1407 C5-methylase (RsmB/RsmF family)
MTKKSGSAKFNQYFSQLYQARWDSILNALKDDERMVARRCFSRGLNESSPIEWLEDCYPLDDQIQIYNPITKLNDYYIMNPGSIIAARSLEVSQSDFVLDMCASPGGKSLILAQALGPEGTLWCNEISANRRVKLKTVIKQHIVQDLQNQIFIKGKDGIKYGIQYPNTFDSILLDAPCSGERHLVHNPKELEKWSEKRTKRLAAIQYGLLCSALLAVKPKGQILYSTCSLSPLENDKVIEKILSKKSDQLKLDLPERHPMAEKTEYGFQFLPDHCQFGPMYFSRLVKL